MEKSRLRRFRVVFAAVDALGGFEVVRQGAEALFELDLLHKAEDDQQRGDEDQDPQRRFMVTAMEEEIKKSLDRLTDREATVLRLRYGIGTSHDHTLEEVGRSMGLTRERDRQIESAAIRKLRSPDFAERLRDFVQNR